jgi:hypothetical protein
VPPNICGHFSCEFDAIKYISKTVKYRFVNCLMFLSCSILPVYRWLKNNTNAKIDSPKIDKKRDVQESAD